MLPHLHFVGNYKIAMRILLLNIHGNGGLTGNFSEDKTPFLIPRIKYLKKKKKKGELSL